MTIDKQHLEKRLAQGLLPIYILTGDEPLQMIETADSIRHQGQQAGYAERIILDINKGFNWGELNTHAHSLSLFNDKKIIDCRFKTLTIGNEGSKALQSYCEQATNNILLLIRLPKCTKAQQSTKWFKVLARFGVLLQFQVIEGKKLIQWIEQRLKYKNIRVENSNVIRLLSEQVEGNLLAAAQEIEKLGLIYPNQTISETKLIEAVSNSSRYNIFILLDCILLGDIKRSEKIFNALYAEGLAAQIILWGLSKELRLLAILAYQIKAGKNITQAINSQKDIWYKRQPLFYAALQRHSTAYWQKLLIKCTKTELILKGQQSGDVWFMLYQIALTMAK